MFKLFCTLFTGKVSSAGYHTSCMADKIQDHFPNVIAFSICTSKAQQSYLTKDSLVEVTSRKYLQSMNRSFTANIFRPQEFFVQNTRQTQPRTVQIEYKCPTLLKPTYPLKYDVPGIQYFEKEMPTLIDIEKVDPVCSVIQLDMPEKHRTGNGVFARGKMPCGMLKIRRSKMNKHKLRKLRKRMRFVWRKVSIAYTTEHSTRTRTCTIPFLIYKDQHRIDLL